MSNIVIIICLILAFIFGFLAGIPITLKLYRAGVLLIDTSNPEKDTYSFQLETPLDKLPEENYISLKVKKVETGGNVVDFNKLLAPPYPDEIQQ